ncbi:GNAT family N-acetyltransferase, partial [Glutamicibacter ardleyensis]
FNPVDGGQGYASEAVSCVLDLCFGPLGLRRVVAECFADNEPSWRLMERIGMRREGYGVQSGLHREGQWLDSMSYAILADEWLARSERDQTLL